MSNKTVHRFEIIWLSTVIGVDNTKLLESKRIQTTLAL